MAEASLSQTIERDFLTCQICMEIFSSPKILPCLHTFCSACAKLMITVTKAARGKVRWSITCPTCRATTFVTNGHVDSLKTNFYIENLVEVYRATHLKTDECAICKTLKQTDVEPHYKCIDCGDFLCESCGNMHTFTRQTIHHKVVALDQLASGAYDQQIKLVHGVQCREHKDELVKFVCKTCVIPVCRDCVMISHKQHDVIGDKEAVEIMRPKLNELMELLKRKSSGYKETGSEIVDVLERIGIDLIQRPDYNKVKTDVPLIHVTLPDDVSSVLTQHKDEEAAINTVHGITLNLVNRISAAKEAAVSKLSGPYTAAKTIISEARDEVLWKLEVNNETKKFCCDVMNAGNVTEILSLHKLMEDRLEQLIHIDALSTVTKSLAIQYPVLRTTKEVIDGQLDLFHVDLDVRGLTDPFVVCTERVTSVDQGNRENSTDEANKQDLLCAKDQNSLDVMDRGCQTEEAHNEQERLNLPANHDGSSKNSLSESPDLVANTTVLSGVTETSEPTHIVRETTVSGTENHQDIMPPGTMLTEDNDSNTVNTASVSDRVYVLTSGAKRCTLEFMLFIFLAILLHYIV